MAYYRTESFHVNVVSGDGAIHLLTSDRTDTTNNPNDLRTVERAILVDGGRNQAADTIDKVVQLIEQRYFCRDVDPVGNNRHLVFDAIVITHWDGDHWQGLARYIFSEILATAQDGIQDPNVLERMYCRCARYDAPDPVTHFHGAPQTFIYMPWMPLTTTGFVPPANNDDTNPVMDIKIPKEGDPNTTFTFTRQFKVRQGADWLLGRNLFLHDGDDRRLSSRGDRKNFLSLQTMLDNHPMVSPMADLQYESWPAMYCVAAQQRTLSSKARIQTTPTNKSSIAFILVWNEPVPGSQQRRYKVSHYFAGDAHSELETALAAWMNPYKAKSMKSSHHGSSSSNPPENFTRWDPWNITVSAGEQYGHPRWEIVFCIDAWFQLRCHEHPDLDLAKPFYPCQWPAYLRQDADHKFMLQTFSVDEILDPTRPLPAWLKARWQEIRTIRHNQNNFSAPNDTYILWQAWRTLFQKLNQRDPNQLETREWIIEHVTRIMHTISPMRAAGPQAGDAHIIFGWFTGWNFDPNSDWNKTMADIYAVAIISAPSGSTDDGKVVIVGENLLAEWVLDTFAAKMAKQIEFPVDCSRAYCLANLNEENPKDQFIIDQYPYLGDDHPSSIDISRRNPKWPRGQELGHVRSDREALGTTAGNEDSWFDLDSEDYVMMMEDNKALSDRSDSREATPATPSIILYRRVPDEVAQAAVYISCTERKMEEPSTCFPADSQVFILDGKNFIFGFVDTLHYRMFGLKTIPDGLNPTPVFDDDELSRWLGQFCAASAAKEPDPGFSLTLSKMTWPIVDKMSRFDFELTMPFPDGSKLQLSTKAGAEQTFAKSTTSTSGNDTAVSLKSLTNMLISRRTLVFGLEDSNSPLTTKFGVAARFFGIDMDKYPLLKRLTGDFGLVLDARKDYHNAIWFRPGMQYETHLRLQFHVNDSFKSEFNGWLRNFSNDLAVDTLLVIMRKKAKWVWTVSSDRMESHGSVTFLCSLVLSPTTQLQGVFELTDTQVLLSLTLQRPKSSAHLKMIQGRDGAVDTILKWISSKFKVANTESLTNLLDQATKGSSTIDNESILPRRVVLLLDLKPDGGIKGIHSGSIDIEACLTVGRSTVTVMEQTPALFLFSFGWSTDSGFYFKGKLWPVVPETPFSHYDRALPEAEEYQWLSPATVVNPERQLRSLDLASLLSTDPSKQVQIPAGLPNEIYACEIALSQKEVSFMGAMRSKPSSSRDSKTPPMLSFEDVQLVASYSWGTDDPAAKGFKLRLMIALNLHLGGKLDPEKPQEEQDADLAKLSGQMMYDRGTWSIEAKVIGLSISHLLQFWDVQDRGCILEFLGSIDIDFVSIRYEFNKGAKDPSKLNFLGQFGIANVATFSLKYVNQGGSDWSFTASLAAENKAGESATIGHLLIGFLDKDIVDVLPDAITGAEIRGANGEEALRLLCCRQNDVNVFAILVQVQDIQPWFVQLKTKDGKTKRLLKAAISKISVNVSIVNTTINSPWEKLSFMWVQDTTTSKVQQQGGKKDTRGVTQAEYDSMKTCLQTEFGIPDDDLMLFKQQEDKSAGSTRVVCLDDEDQDDKAKKIVIHAGMHLVVVARRADGKLDLILDYLFDGGNKGSGKSQNPAPDPAGSPEGTKAPFKAKLGPLSLANIGLWYKKGMIGITLDARLLLGPLGLELLGFTIGMPFSDKYSLKNPPPIDAMTSNPKIEVMYTGGLVVGFKPWLFEAMGAYANVTKGLKFNSTTIDTDPTSIMHTSSATTPGAGDAEETFTFAFIYVRLDGPLFSVGFADFSGLVGGFGVNSDIVLPTVDQVFEFPFVKEPTEDGSPSSGPIEKMQSLMQGPWFRPAEGLYWGAAGVRVTAFQMLAANIVLVVQFGNGNVVIGIFGVATCDVPALASPVRFAHAELGMICTFDVNSGVFKLEAQLSPRSFVLAPECHLTGGLALYAWFKTDLAANVRAGDWVLTIGGYLKAFHPPRQYPVPPPTRHQLVPRSEPERGR